MRYLAATRAGTANSGRRAGARARATAGRARHLACEFDLLLDPGRRFRERDGQLDLQVAAAIAAPPARAPLAESEPAEKVGKVREDVLDTGEALKAGAARPVVAEPVIELALLRIG